MPRIVLLASGEHLFAGLALWTFGQFGQKAWLHAAWDDDGQRLRSRSLAGRVPPQNPEDIGASIVAAARAVGATHIVPDDVATFIAVAEIAEDAAPIRTFPSNTAKELLDIDDKATFTSKAMLLDLPVIPTKVADDAAMAATHGFDYPIHVKPALGSGSYGNRVFHQPHTFQGMLDAWPKRTQIIQPFVPGTDAHVTFLADHGELIAWEIREPYPSDRPVPGVVHCFHDEEMLDIARRYAAGTSYHGLANLDFRRAADGGTPYLLECNPRLYASIDFAAQAGVNFLQLGLDLADGRRPDRPCVSREGLVYRVGAFRSLLRRSPGALFHKAAVRAAASALVDPKLTVDMWQARQKATS